MSAWRKAGFSFNKYVSISSKTLRSVLKDDLKIVAEKRNEADIKVQKFSKGESITEAEPLTLTK